WHPSANDSASTVAVVGSTVLAGGAFTALGSAPQASLARISSGTTEVTPVKAGAPLSAAPTAPNPTRGAVILRFALSLASRVSITVFDPGGRQVARVLDRAPRRAGEQQVTIRT